jgi:hypothetical protein
MSLEGNVEYALTRVQSQHGSRPDKSEWRRLEASHDLGQYLEGTRSSIFRQWVSSLDSKREAHSIERTLRAAWRSYVRTVAAWHPRRWQPWLSWLEWLPTLGLIARLEHAGPVPAWLLADPLLGPAARRATAERPGAVKGTSLAVFEPAINGHVLIAEFWLARWRELRPPVDAFTEQLLAAVLRALQEHVRRLAVEGANGVALRDQLRERLEKLFRAAAGTLGATLCHLALTALDFERLRGGLVNRSLFARGK